MTCLSDAGSVCQSWGVLLSQTELLSQLMKKRSEDLLDGPISKLTLLIRDKQQLRKTYAEHWNLLRQELIKVQNKHVRTHTHSNARLQTPTIMIKTRRTIHASDLFKV